MTQIDGILVLDAVLDVAIAGAKFMPAEGMSLAQPFIDATKQRGARHRAGAAIATRLPKTLCFVVSQDGGVTAFRHDDGVPTVRRLKM